jgi:hypothetical protein
MTYRCISVNSQIEHEFGNHTYHTIYPQAILIEDINQDNVRFNEIKILAQFKFDFNKNVFNRKTSL